MATNLVEIFGIEYYDNRDLGLHTKEWFDDRGLKTDDTFIPLINIIDPKKGEISVLSPKYLEAEGYIKNTVKSGWSEFPRDRMKVLEDKKNTESLIATAHELF